MKAENDYIGSVYANKLVLRGMKCVPVHVHAHGDSRLCIQELRLLQCTEKELPGTWVWVSQLLVY
jgi:hypothetical protein